MNNLKLLKNELFYLGTYDRNNNYDSPPKAYRKGDYFNEKQNSDKHPHSETEIPKFPFNLSFELVEESNYLVM